MAIKNSFENSIKYARRLDREDPLRDFRKRFLLPKIKDQAPIYLIGNSLGLQPKDTRKFVQQELEDWARLGGEGHLHAHRPWVYYHHLAKKSLAKLVGANVHEVVAMNQLTVNLHLMLVTFYRPDEQRYKIIAEAGAFSSDQYALESQLKFHGVDPEKALIELRPRAGHSVLMTEDILQAISDHKRELALVFFGGVQYYTGQFFDLKAITRAGKAAGAVVGYDLAHAIGNVPLNLHDDDVDFAVWCSYKYLNSGPGAIAGAYVHERHGDNPQLPRFAGWWGHSENERFEMRKGFKPMTGVDGWQLSNVPILQGAAHLAALKLFDEAGIKNLRKKSIQLTGFLEFILKEADPNEAKFSIITPANPAERGCQLSLFIKSNGKNIFKKLQKRNVIADWREPDVIRVAPTPFYNTFEEVFRFVEIFKTALNEK